MGEYLRHRMGIHGSRRMRTVISTESVYGSKFLGIVQVNNFFQADAPDQIFFEHRLGPGPILSSHVAVLDREDSYGSSRISAIRARRGSVGARRFSGLGVPPESVLDRNDDRSIPDTSLRTSSQGDEGTVFVEEAWGHLHAGFGEDLTTKSPIVYFSKMSCGGGKMISPYKASIVFFGRKF